MVPGWVGEPTQCMRKECVAGIESWRVKCRRLRCIFKKECRIKRVGRMNDNARERSEVLKGKVEDVGVL